MRIVVKIGTSSLTDDSGALVLSAVEKVCAEVASVRTRGVEVVLVTSAAISAGLPELGFGSQRPVDPTMLQVAAAVGQSRLMRAYDDSFAQKSLVSGQILLSARDFIDRHQYLHARSTLEQMIKTGVVPVINENDAVCDDEIRWGDNDRLAALVSHAVSADMLILLTDTDGLFTADPRFEPDASLVKEVSSLDDTLRVAVGGSGSNRGSGGMASKLVAARMASRAGIKTVIANASRVNVIGDAIDARDIGTWFQPTERRMPARKVWIAYALGSSGRIHIDQGAETALLGKGGSLLSSGVTKVEGDFDRGDGVEVLAPNQQLLAKGIVRLSSSELDSLMSRDSRFGSSEVIHRNDLTVLVDQ